MVNREILTVQVRIFGRVRMVNEEKGTIGGGGERHKVVGVALSERWVVDKWGWEGKSSGDRR